MVNSIPSTDEPRLKLRVFICLCSTLVHFTLTANKVAITISFEALIDPSTESDVGEKITKSPVNSSKSNETTISKLSSYQRNDHHVKVLNSSDVTKLVNQGHNNKTSSSKLVITESTKDQWFEIIFLGGLFSPIPTGRLAEKYGPKLIVTLLLLANAMAMSLFPLVAGWSIYAAAVLLFLKGAGTSPLFSCSSVVCAHWCPRYEKTIYVSTVATGTMIAIIAVNPLAGYLCSLDLLGGWPLCFYVMASINILITIIWVAFITNDPSEHPMITQAEKEVILRERTPIDEFNTKAVPYRAIFTSVPTWALFLAHLCSYWFIALISHQIPDYFKTVLNVSITEDGFLSSLPYVGSAVSLTIFSYIIDKLRAHGRFSTTAIRKISADIGFIFAPTFLILSSFFGKKYLVVITCVVIAQAMAAAQIAGIYSVHLDMAPSYVGTLAGMIETISNLGGVLMNHATVYLIGDQPTLHHWLNLFLVTAVVCIIGTHYFALLGSSKLQPWDPTFKSDEKAIEDDQNGELTYPTVFDPEIFVFDPSTGSVIRKYSIASVNLNSTTFND